MSNEFKGLGFYYHFKHDLNKGINDHAYEVINIAHHSEEDDLDKGALVIYLPLYESSRVYKAGKHFDARPLSNFTEEVTRDGKTFQRFIKITDPEVILFLQKKKTELYK